VAKLLAKQANFSQILPHEGDFFLIIIKIKDVPVERLY
jgi:hypothetical protein